MATRSHSWSRLDHSASYSFWTESPRRLTVKRCRSAAYRQATAPRLATAAAAAAAPERSVVVLPGLGNNAADYARVADALRQQWGLHVEVAPVKRLDWARNAAGLRYASYWRGTLEPLPTVQWYFDRIEGALAAAREAAPDAPISLLAHSAGGWMGRAWLLSRYDELRGEGAQLDCYVSLGSPQLPPPPGVVDQTRGILTWCAANCPGGLHEGLEYVTLAGRYIKGAPLIGPGTWQQRVVGAGYKTVCGDASAWGDGITPVPAAHLPEALNVTLEGCYHSPLGAVDGRSLQSVAESSDEGEAAARHEEEVLEAEAPAPGQQRLWYGSAGMLEQWADLLDPAVARVRRAAAAAGAAK